MTVPAIAVSKSHLIIAFEMPPSEAGSCARVGLFDQELNALGSENLSDIPISDMNQTAAAASCSLPRKPRGKQNGEQLTDIRQNAGGGEWTGDLRWKSVCSTLLSVSEESVSDVDLLTLLLSHAHSEADARSLATQLIQRFETFGNVLSARCGQISGITEIPPEMIDLFRLVRAAGTRLAREEISNRPVLDAWNKLLAYLRSAMAHQKQEQFRVLFLDRRNVLIADEVQNRGTIDHAPVYPREVAKRALELDASAIIMAHNHPSNNPAPSKGDIQTTQIVSDALERLGIVLHDHIIISRRGHSSFREMGFLNEKP